MGTVRILLALSVLLAHSRTVICFGVKLIGGFLAVKLFFVVSGFYMGMILKEKYSNTNNRIFLFWSNRFLRIFPVYWAILAVSVVVDLALWKSGDGLSGALQSWVQFGRKVGSVICFFSRCQTWHSWDKT